MGFGKKPATSHQASASQPPTDPHGHRAAELLLGGQSPLVPDAAAVSARVEQGKAAFDARHAQVQRNAQARFADAQIRPFFLIPDPCWNGPTGTFLMTSLELYPYDDWNVMFLAGDARTADTLDLALHPNGNVPAFVHAADKVMDDARMSVDAAHADAELSRTYGAYHDAREDARGRVKLLAGQFAKQLVDAWQKRSASRGL